MQFRRVSGPPLYQHTAEGPVRYVVVANEDGVLGYLWVPLDSGSPMTGRIVTGSEGTAPSLTVLKELAG